MNYAHSYSVKTKVVKQLGYFPAFLIPAINSSLVFRSLVQQTLTAYVDNPLPDLFKEKLFVVLSRYFGASYFTICHSCTLLSLGVSPEEILALEKITVPQSEGDIALDLASLKSQWHSGKNWHDSSLQASLIRCSCLIFLQPVRADKCSEVLKELLGTAYYNYLGIFLGYIKLGHRWLADNPKISHQKDPRSQLHLGSLLLSDSRLTQFLQSNIQLELSHQNKIAVKTSREDNNFCLFELNSDRHSLQKSSHQYVERERTLVLPHLSLKSQHQKLARSSYVSVRKSLPSQITRENLTEYLTKISFPVMIHAQNEKILYLNHNWIETTGFSKTDIPTLGIWKQKARVTPCNIKQLAAELARTTDLRFSSQLSKVSTQTRNMMREIALSLSNLAEEIDKLEVENSMAQIVKNRVSITTRNGNRRLWESHTAPFSLGKNKDKLMISVAQDITGIIKSKSSQSKINKPLDLLMEEASSGSWSWNLASNKIDICHIGRSILGLGDFNGSYQSFLQSVHSQARESVNKSLIEAVKNGQDVDLQYPLVKANCAISWIRQTCNLGYNSVGEVVKLSGIIMNVTPPKTHSLQIESAQQNRQTKVTQSHNELAKIINLLPSYVFVSDIHDETISLINLKLSNSLNLPKPENIGGKTMTISECFDPEYARQILWHQQQILTYGKEVHVKEEVNLPDGIHYFDTTIAPLRNDDGEIYALLYTSNDIPDLADTKEALSQRTLQLEAANKELESFSYSVSHDLQAPLRVINGFSQVLWDNYQPDLDDRGKHYLQRIQANSEKMSDLIDALLQLSRVTRSQMKSVEVNLSQIARNIMEELQQEDPERNVEFAIAENLIATGDPQLLRIVLDNLLNNAWKYTSKRSQGKIEFNATVEEDNKITFYIKDNGAGFDLEYADKLFTAFKRLHSQAEFPGTGIGLATVQRIIYRHGGKVWADGECNLGATIYFSLEA